MFIDDRINETIAYGFRGGPTFRTTRAKQYSGYERRNAELTRPKWQFTLPYDRVDSLLFEDLIATYIACRGPVHSFRLKDYADFHLNDVLIGSGTGAEQEIQIVKPYTFFGETVNRPIKKPVDGSRFTVANGYRANATALSVTSADTPISFSCDYTTGILTLTAGDGEAIRVTGEFDVPVYFDEDQLEFDFVNWRAHSTNIRVVEDFSAGEDEGE